MIYKDFKDKKLSALGLGMMRLPVIDGNSSDIDWEKAEEMVDFAIQNGINYFDTAWGYHGGNSEIAVGKFLSKYPRQSFYLASKFPGYDSSTMNKVEEIFEKQLEKCKTPYFDFYLFHNVCESNIDGYLNPEFGIMKYLLEQKKNGRIKHLGFSAHGSMSVIKRFLKAYGSEMEFCQLQINYMDWHFQSAKEKVEFIRSQGIPIWVMEPLRGGKLATVTKEIEKKLKEMRPEESIPAWAFRFLQAIEGVTVTLSGMSNMEQLKENIKIWSEDKPLNEAEFDCIVKMTDAETRKGKLACTACSYCVSYCPQELSIPELIALYNEHKITGGGFIAPMAVSSMSENKRPASCVGCRSCEQVCPQGIKISEMMSEFAEMMGE